REGIGIRNVDLIHTCAISPSAVASGCASISGRGPQMGTTDRRGLQEVARRSTRGNPRGVDGGRHVADAGALRIAVAHGADARHARNLVDAERAEALPDDVLGWIAT